MSGQPVEVIVMGRPVQRAAASLEVREGSTGRVVRRCGQRFPHGLKPVAERAMNVGAEARALQSRSCSGRTLANGVPSTLSLLPKRPVQLDRVWAVAAEVEPAPPARQAEPELAFYRKYTEALLRRYLQMSVTSGRVPSLMGREMFRGNVTHCRTHTMEDVVIFCMDVEKTLQRLQPMEQRLILRIALQHYSQAEAAGMLGLSLRGAIQRYHGALDRLTALLLEARMLEPLKGCQ